MLLSGNQLTNIGTFENLPQLRYLYIQDNKIGEGGNVKIPDFSGCPRMQYLIGFNNKFSGYENGAFKDLGMVRVIDFSNNPNLSQSAMEKIFEDLVKNWENSNRGGVSINFKGCGSQSEVALESILFLRGKGWSITID